jgi:hypothetical protein
MIAADGTVLFNKCQLNGMGKLLAKNIRVCSINIPPVFVHFLYGSQFLG